MNFLNMLMQSLGGAGEEEEEFDPNAPIEVMGARGRSQSQEPMYGDPEERPVTRQRYILNDDRMAPTEKELKEIIPRSQGYFGSKGTLRDILGGISDAFLVQGGADAKYEKLRDRERKGDAMFGFTDNPQQAMERMAAGGYTDDAEKLQSNFATQEYQQGNLASQQANRQSLADDRTFDNTEKTVTRLARGAMAGMSYEQLAKFAANRGISPEQLSEMGIVPGMTEDQRRQAGAFDISGQNQQMFPLRERSVKAQEKNAASSALRASRPPAGRAPTQPRALNDEERLEAAYAVPPAQRSEYQRSLIERKNRTGGGSGRSRERRPVAPPSPRPGWGVRPIPN